ncbi:hypothetical protein HBH98_180930 [Parastagonospora nodorum]|nr:hypothetical protein HBH43_048610 [Parastagonospora nodorum]KAH4341148.1 hypothetical protein HBH98_180930 [Parastagonospora nodorum]KAH4378204.1 hypothetical protein HBH99_206070 [Parastagonospora nodorum]KAH4385047.1 hypothetical protein HBH97_073050 [Parastagonospora nodorum]KAH5391915.1 hypothetical protein HBI33_016720 [Parastagonospora nodorum]
MEDVKSLAVAIKKETKKVDMNEGQQRAWNKMKRAISQGVFYRPRSGMNYVGEAIAYNLWNRGLLEDWINRVEKVVDSINKLYERDYHVRTGEHYNEDLNRARELLRLESFASKLHSKACGLYNACTAANGTCRWGLALHPPEAGEDVSRWDFQIPINIEMRFTCVQKQDVNDRFRLRVAYEDGISDEDTIAEALAGIGQITGHVDTGLINTYAISEWHEQGQFSRETLPLSQLLDSEPLLFESEGWLENLPERIFGISQWSILLWNTPWVEKFCCHGLTVEIDSNPVGRTRHVFESRQHGACQTQQDIPGLKRVGLVCAQLVLGVPIRPSSTDMRFEFEIKVNETWRPISVRGINAEVNKATGSRSLVEAISFCLGPGTESFDENFKFGYLHKLIDKMHKPIKDWYESQSPYVRKIKAIQARKMSKLPQVEKWAEEIMVPMAKDHSHEQEVSASGSDLSSDLSLTPKTTTRKDSILAPRTRRRSSSRPGLTRLSPIGEAWV